MTAGDLRVKFTSGWHDGREIILVSARPALLFDELDARLSTIARALINGSTVVVWEGSALRVDVLRLRALPLPPPPIGRLYLRCIEASTAV
jgi:hypothetical protein